VANAAALAVPLTAAAPVPGTDRPGLNTGPSGHARRMDGLQRTSSGDRTDRTRHRESADAVERSRRVGKDPEYGHTGTHPTESDRSGTDPDHR
jgi:hypothetical protein